MRTPRRFSDEARRARLAVRHHLLPRTRTDDLAEIADDLVALHSTDPVTVYLSAMARMANPSVAAVERAIYDERSLIRHHGMRRTLWLATPDVVRLIHAAATRKLVGPETRRTAKMLASAGVAEPERWIEDARSRVRAHLAEHGPCSARELGLAVEALRQPLHLAPGKAYSTIQSAHTRVLTLMGFAGEVIRARPTGTWVNAAYRYAIAEDWLAGGLGELDPGPSATELAGRWLRRFGPATTTDLQWWMGWTLRMTKQSLAGCGAVEVALESGPGWLAPDDEADPPAEPWVAVLPGLDPTTMGWKERGWYLPAAAQDLFDTNGNGGPSIWVDGRIVGAWAQRADGEVIQHYFERVAARRRHDVDERIAELRSAVGSTRFSVRFPGIIHDRLAPRRSGAAGGTATL